MWLGTILRKAETSKIDKLGPSFQELGPSLRKDKTSKIYKLGPSFLELGPILRKDESPLSVATVQSVGAVSYTHLRAHET